MNDSKDNNRSYNHNKEELSLNWYNSWKSYRNDERCCIPINCVRL